MFATGDCLIVSPDTKEKVPNKVTSEKISEDKDRKLLMIIMVVGEVVGQVVNEQKCKLFVIPLIITHRYYVVGQIN